MAKKHARKPRSDKGVKHGPRKPEPTLAAAEPKAEGAQIPFDANPCCWAPTSIPERPAFTMTVTVEVQRLTKEDVQDMVEKAEQRLASAARNACEAL